MWLPRLADAQWMGGTLSELAGSLGIAGEITDVRLVEARLTHPHRPESPLCRGWAIYLVTPRDAEPVQLYVKGFPAGASGVAWQQDRVARPAGHRTHVPGLDLVVWRFPQDPRLAALPELVSPRPSAHIVPRAVRDVLGPEWTTRLRTTVVRYQPEASATLRLEIEGDTGPSVYAKHLAGDTVADVGARHQALWATMSQRGLRVAEPLAADSAHGVLWTRGVPGCPLAHAVPESRLADATRQVGPVLAALHASATEAPGLLTVDDLLGEAAKKSRKLARAHPPAGPVVSDLVAAATRRRAHVRHDRACTLHGDFHLNQLVWSEEGPVLVDLDSIVGGPPEVDLAEFVVDLAMRELPGDVARDVSRALLSSYASAAGTRIDEAVLEICADAEFVNRCYRHLRGRARGWQLALESALERRDEMVALLRP